MNKYQSMLNQIIKIRLEMDNESCKLGNKRIRSYKQEKDYIKNIAKNVSKDCNVDMISSLKTIKRLSKKERKKYLRWKDELIECIPVEQKKYTLSDKEKKLIWIIHQIKINKIKDNYILRIDI